MASVPAPMAAAVAIEVGSCWWGFCMPQPAAAGCSGLNFPCAFVQLHMSPVVPQIFVFFVSFPHFFDVNSHSNSHY